MDSWGRSLKTLAGGATVAAAGLVLAGACQILAGWLRFGEALPELEGQLPAIHAKFSASLYLHLAARLMATTEIARGR